METKQVEVAEQTAKVGEAAVETKETQTEKAKAVEQKAITQKPMTYDQLKDAAMQLQQQLFRSNQENQMLRTQLENIQRAEQLQYLGFAFKVLEFRTNFEEKFVANICSFITAALTMEEPRPELSDEAKDTASKS